MLLATLGKVIVPVGKGILMGAGAASIVGSIVTFAQKRGSGNRSVDLSDYEFYSDEYGQHVDFDDMPRHERAEVIADVMSGDMVL